MSYQYGSENWYEIQGSLHYRPMVHTAVDSKFVKKLKNVLKQGVTNDIQQALLGRYNYSRMSKFNHGP